VRLRYFYDLSQCLPRLLEGTTAAEHLELTLRVRISPENSELTNLKEPSTPGKVPALDLNRRWCQSLLGGGGGSTMDDEMVEHNTVSHSASLIHLAKSKSCSQQLRHFGMFR